MKKATRLLCTVLAFVGVLTTAHAQNSKLAKKLYPEFQQSLSKADTSSYFADTAISLGLRIITAETEFKDKALDTLFFANICNDLGKLLQGKYAYETAVQYYLLAASSYNKLNLSTKAGSAISKYLYGFSVIRELRNLKPAWGSSDSAIFKHGKEDTTLWFTAPAQSLYKIPNSDTLWVNLNIGRAQGIVKNSKFDIFTTFDTFSNYSRSVEQAGTGFITEINDFSSTGFVVLFKEFKDTIYLEDAFEVKVVADKEWVKSAFSILANYNITLYNYTGESYYSAGDGNLTLNNQRFDKDLKRSILQDLKDAVKYYNENNPGILDVVIKSGPFKGQTYGGCMENAQMFDLDMFFDYVNSYPAKYINRKFSFAEVFVTWVINDCPLGNGEMMVIDSLMTMEPGYLKNNSLRWGEYYKQVTKRDSVYFAEASNKFELNPDGRMLALSKMHELAVATQNKKSDSFFAYKLVLESYSRSKYQKCIENCDILWPQLQGFDKLLISLYKGMAYSALNNNDEALRYLDTCLALDSTYYYAIGFKGWNLIKVGNVKKAIPLCKYAWEVDSAVTWTNINLAHALVLKGEEKEAKRLYYKSFDFMTVASDFYAGMLADFDYFIEKGLNETKFSELRTEYLNYFNSQRLHGILADSLKQRGITLEDRKDYKSALGCFVAAEKEFKLTPQTDWSDVRSVARWTGYIYYKMKDFQNSLLHYKRASEITIQNNLGEDNLVSDYQDMANIYDWLDDTLKQAEYDSRSSSLEVGLREKRDPKKLFMLVIGPDSKGLNDSFAKSDAMAISERIESSANLQFDEVINRTLIGANASVEKVLDALDSAIYTLGENDVFMFYFSGYGRIGGDEGIQLNNAVLTLRDLAGYLGQIPAGRQVHIADCNGLNWREWYQHGNFGLLANSKRSLIFLGSKNARIEEKSIGHSVLTGSLLTAYDRAAKDGEITGAEWVGSTVTGMLAKNYLYAVEFQTFGHDFVLGKQKIALQTQDTFAPQIELFGATAVRGENISLVSTKGAGTGRITDDSKVVFAQANGIPLITSQNGRFELPKELNGVKNIRIIAVDEFGNRSQRDFIVTQSDNAASNEGTKYAFLFASDEYTHWTDLANPVFDAKRIGELLEKNYGYKVELILNPAKRLITEKLDFIRRVKYKSNDQLFVFFAGHGLNDSIYGGYYVCPESQLPANDKFFDSYFPQQTIADLIDGAAVKNAFLVMDVCFGGKMFDKHDNHQFKTVNDGNELSADEYIKRQLQIPCRQFLTSGGNNYVEDGVPGAHSPFAMRFIKALEDGATNKDYITASEIMDYLWLMRTVGNDKRSFPRYGFFGGDKDGEYVLKVTTKIRNSAVIAGI